MPSESGEGAHPIASKTLRVTYCGWFSDRKSRAKRQYITQSVRTLMNLTKSLEKRNAAPQMRFSTLDFGIFCKNPCRSPAALLGICVLSAPKHFRSALSFISADDGSANAPTVKMETTRISSIRFITFPPDGICSRPPSEAGSVAKQTPIVKGSPPIPARKRSCIQRAARLQGPWCLFGKENMRYFWFFVKVRLC